VQQFVNYTFSGLTTAAIFAIAASGLVLLYTTTGVFNFAHGAMGMVAAFTYWEMRFGWHWPAPIALIVCLLILAPAFGVLLEIGIMRRLEGTSETTKLVVTLSLLLGLLGLALWVWDPSWPRAAGPDGPYSRQRAPDGRRLPGGTSRGGRNPGGSSPAGSGPGQLGGKPFSLKALAGSQLNRSRFGWVTVLSTTNPLGVALRSMKHDPMDCVAFPGC
jgi:branched-subunit amino acid ABC-type transport system permease component